jgi:hypothetical protein
MATPTTIRITRSAEPTFNFISYLLDRTVQGSGFRVQGSGFRVQGSGFRVQQKT